MTVTAIDATLGAGPAWHKFSSGRAIVSVVLNEAKGRVEARTDLHIPTEVTGRASTTEGHLSVIPQGCDAWGYSDGVGFVREVRFSVDRTAARETYGDPLDVVLDTPSLMRVDRQVHGLARLLFLDAQQNGADRLYAEGLLAALFARLGTSQSPRDPDFGVGGLTPGQLRLVKDFIAGNAAENISLGELTALVGLSRSQFGRAFKASTGKSPHRWHREARVNLAKDLLQDPDRSLVDVALSAGFSEQSHFNRVFRVITGVTPGAWRRDHAESAPQSATT